MYKYICIFGLLFFAGCNILNKKIDVSAPQTWTVASDPTKAKASHEYDAIIVGAGIGGLTSAALLAVNGYKVIVLEQQKTVGGFCTSFERDGYTFPAGPHDISGCTHGAVGMLLEKLNLKRDDLFALHTRTYTIGNKTITFTGTDNDVVEKLTEVFPAEEQALKEFFAQARTAYNEQLNSRRNPQEPTPTYTEWQHVTYQQKLDQFFRDARLKEFLCSLIGYIGTKPEQTTASSALMACLQYFIYGGHYPKAGGSRFAHALKEVIEAHGGTVSTNTKVDTVLVSNSRASGVAAGDKTFLSSIVIVNANARNLFTRMLPEGALAPEFIDAIKALKMSCSDTVAHLGVALDLSHMSSIVKNDDCSFIITSNADKQSAPHACASISIDLPGEYADTPELGTPAYEQYKQSLIQQATAKLEKVIPGISEHIVTASVVTPRTFEQYTSMPEGAIYSFDQTAGSKRPYFKTPIIGLYLASSSTHIGAGVEAVVATGMMCARDILAHKVKP